MPLMQPLSFGTFLVWFTFGFPMLFAIVYPKRILFTGVIPICLSSIPVSIAFISLLEGRIGELPTVHWAWGFALLPVILFLSIQWKLFALPFLTFLGSCYIVITNLVGKMAEFFRDL